MNKVALPSPLDTLVPKSAADRPGNKPISLAKAVSAQNQQKSIAAVQTEQTGAIRKRKAADRLAKEAIAGNEGGSSLSKGSSSSTRVNKPEEVARPSKRYRVNSQASTLSSRELRRR